MEGDVAAGMAGHGQHVEVQRQGLDPDAIAVPDAVVGHGDAFVHRGVAGQPEAFPQRLGAAHVVGVVMGGEDRGELQLLAREIVEHRPRLAWIDDRGMCCIAHRPDIVVLERADRYYLHASSLRSERRAEV